MDSGEGITKTFKIPITHLDYDYIKKCSNILELEKIYLTLKTGEEGMYPDLEKFCENHLKELSPNSRVLRKASELVLLNQLDTPLKQEIINDLVSWVDDIQFCDKSLQKSKPSDNGDNSGCKDFPIRHKQAISTTNLDSKIAKSSVKSCKPKDYNEWSKIANELEKQMILEEKEEAVKPMSCEPKKPKDVKGLSLTIDTTKMSELERDKIAILEKDKGNEAFKSGDFSESVVYYSRSLSVAQIDSVYNNRGLAYMKQKKWDEAIQDLSLALKKSPSNIKALQRRATCYSEIHNLPSAINDSRKILKISPNNKFAENMLSTSLVELEKRTKPKLKDGKRMVITEINSDDESSCEEECQENIVEKCIDNASFKEQKETIEEKVIEATVLNDEINSEQEFIKIKDHGNQLFKELKYCEALEVYNQLVVNWPLNPIGYRNRAACNLVLEKPTEVIEDCTKAIELDKDSHLSYYRRGKAYKILKMYHESSNDLETALKISPNHIQIKDEFNEVKALSEKHNSIIQEVLSTCKESFIENDSENVSNFDKTFDSQISENSSNEETICVGNYDEQETTNQDVSNTWEFLGMSELTDCSEHNSISNPVIEVRPSSDKPMTKYEFDKQLNNIRIKNDWKTTIQLLMDAGPTNISSLFGTKLDGFILENIVSSLLVYCKTKEHTSFIKTILYQLTKVERFCFIKLMISDHAISELNQLFNNLKQINEDDTNLAELDCLYHQYI